MGQSALSNDQQTELDAAFGCRWYLSTPTSAQALLGTALTNIPGGSGSVLEPIGGIPVDTATFVTADLQESTTLIVESASGERDVMVARVKSSGSVIAAGAGTVQISMLAKTDLGMLNNGMKKALDDNQNVRLLKYPILTYRPSQFTSAPAYYRDGDITYTSQNEQTPCVLRLGNWRAAWVDDYRTASPASYSTLSFTANHSLWPTSASISTYAWTIPGTWTVTVGSSSTQSFTAQVPAGYYVLKCIVTDNNGVTTMGQRIIFVHDASNLPLSISEAQFSADANGWKATVYLPGTGYQNILPGAPCIVWTDNTATTALRTQYVGWIAKVTKTSEPGNRGARVEIVGPGHRLTQLQAPPQILTRAASSFNWIKATTNLSTYSFFVWWLAFWGTNYPEWFDWTPYAVSASSYRLGEFTADRTSMLGQLRGKADTPKTELYFNASGHVTVDRPYYYLTTAERSSANKRDTITAARVTRFIPDGEVYPSVGRIDSSAFSDDGSTTTARRSLANGTVGGAGPEWRPLENLSVNSQDELDDLTSLELAWANNPYPSISCEFEKFRNVYEVGDVLQTSIASTYTPDVVAFDDDCVVIGINANIGEHGTGTVSLQVALATNNEVRSTPQTVSSAVVVFS